MLLSDAKYVNKPKIAIRCIAFLLIMLLVWMIADVAVSAIIYKAAVKTRPVNGAVNPKVLWVLENPDKTHPGIDFTIDDITEETLYKSIKPETERINYRNDVMDFTAMRLYRFVVAADGVMDKLSPDGAIRKLVDDCFLNMKFWITEPGDDSVCYYSENHQICYFAMEYLLGLRYPESKFANDGKTGRQKAAEGRRRALIWLAQRSKYGFSEFYSANYLPYDFAGLSMILLYGDKTDTELMQKTKIVLDLLCLDYAFAYSNGTIIGAQGRAYSRNNMNSAYHECGSDVIVDAIWNNSQKYGKEYYVDTINLGTFVKLLCTNDDGGNPIYTVPQAIKNVGLAKNAGVIKTSSGVNLADYKKENLLGQGEAQIMYQLGAGALTNPEVIENTMEFADRYNLYTNSFLSSLKYTDITLLKWLGVFPGISKDINLASNGMALQKNNTYIYKTADYKLSSVQNYNVGTWGAQQTTMAAVLGEGVVVYTMNPANTNASASLGYWAGYGVAPHAAQSENVCVMIHRLEQSGLMSKFRAVPEYTHTFFPEELFDEVLVEGNYAFCRVGNALLAIIGKNSFDYLEYDATKATGDGMDQLLGGKKRFDLVQKGRNQFTVYELSTLADEGSFAAFVARIQGNNLQFKGNSNLTYVTNYRTIHLLYGGDFSVNGKVQSCNYGRYESDFVQANYGDEDFVISAGGATHHVNLPLCVRE